MGFLSFGGWFLAERMWADNLIVYDLWQSVERELSCYISCGNVFLSGGKELSNGDTVHFLHAIQRGVWMDGVEVI